MAFSSRRREAAEELVAVWGALDLDELVARVRIVAQYKADPAFWDELLAPLLEDGFLQSTADQQLACMKEEYERAVREQYT